MEQTERIAYEQTGYFSKLVLDYLSNAETIQPFYKHRPSVEGIKQSIEARQGFNTNRKLLVEQLKLQYHYAILTQKQENNLSNLLQENCFTICTAHQPNIFTGPLYFIYKILHAIKLSAFLKEQLPQYNFVPVYYMGSEDADLDELGHIFLDGEKITWQTDQQGAVGRMNTTNLNKITLRLQGQFGHLPFGAEMVELCKTAYIESNNIQQATLRLVNSLFKDFGLLVLIPDNKLLKQSFDNILEKELFEQFSNPLVIAQSQKLNEHYKAQANGRDINLFYLQENGSRNRIEWHADKQIFKVVDTHIELTKEAIKDEIDYNAERFSPNVILRGVFQETILPNVAFIGGGGELAYWLQLKTVFEAAGVPYPVLVLRNSFLLHNEKTKNLKQKLGINTNNLFNPYEKLLNEKVIELSKHSLKLTGEKEKLNLIYSEIENLAGDIDNTLKSHVAALQTKTLKAINGLEKKMLRAEKRKHEALQNQLKQLKTLTFPANNLQERIDNFMPLYAQYGKSIIEKLYKESLAFEAEFVVLEI